MNERHARDVTALEAFETAQPQATSWNDDDRAWADRVALEAVAADAPGDAFVAERARHALQRLAPREPMLQRLLGREPARRGWGIVVVLIAFAAGVAGDAIGGSQRINLLAPPFWGVLVWNLVVYLLLIVAPLVAALRRAPRAPGPLVRAMEGLLRSRRLLPRASADGGKRAVGRFASLWLERTRRLAALRAQTLLHAGAAALALGLAAGMVVRGLALDYRVVWESTFLDAAAAHAIVGTVLGPAAALAGIALPDASQFATLRAAPGAGVVGAPAAPWLLLIALTLIGAVVVPRTLLALGCAAIAAARRRRFPLPLDAPYYQRLLRLRRGGPAHVSVHPWGVVPTPQATLGLRALLAAALGPRLEVEVAPVAGTGSDDEAAPRVDPRCTHAVALFDLGATPELESQGRFLRALAGAVPGGATVAPVIDATAFTRRFASLGSRVAERSDAWRSWGESVGAAPVVVELEAPGVASAEAALQAAFAHPGAPAAP